MIYFIFFLLIVIFLYHTVPIFHCFINSPFYFLFYCGKDFINYCFKYRNIPKKPFIRCYVGLFGSGKTLSAVHDVILFYKLYNDKRVWDDRIGEYVTQKVFILSNVDLKGVPYRKFHSLQQVVNIARWRHITDRKKKVRTLTIILGDEFSVQMNSRNFAKNINGNFLGALLQSRHSLIHGFYLTSQRFGHMDALLRQNTSFVIECSKSWRAMKNTWYDAWEYENAANKNEIKPLIKTFWLVKDSDYSSYDTLQIVQDLNKACDDDSLLPPEVILARQGSGSGRVTVKFDAKKKKLL